jgi:hypothetical protein
LLIHQLFASFDYMSGLLFTNLDSWVKSNFFANNYNPPLDSYSFFNIEATTVKDCSNRR